jgi:hypothetical protein
MAMVNELNASKRLILKYFGLGRILMHIPGLTLDQIIP